MLLGGGAEGEEEQVLDPDELLDGTSDTSTESPSHVDPLEEYKVTTGMSAMFGMLSPSNPPRADEIMGLIGSEIAKMHRADIIHGDLTTSNMIIRHPFASRGTSPTKMVRDLLTCRRSPWSTEH